MNPKQHGNCIKHQYRELTTVVRSIGRVTIESCNNCLSVVVIQKRDTDIENTRTYVTMPDSAYRW
jgi:hypothetical protein